MNRPSLLSLLLGAWLVACGPPAPDPSPADGGAVLTPDAGTSSAALSVVRVHYPTSAQTLSLRGSAPPLRWDRGVPGTREDADTWRFELEDVSTPLEFKPLLDDATWSRGANVLLRPGETVDVSPRFHDATGEVELAWAAFHSVALGNDRPIWVYLPPGYAENPHARFPVMYLQDGQNLFDAALAFGGTEWQVDESLDRGAEALARGETLRPLIVVGVGNTAARMDEYTLTRDEGVGAGGRGAAYLAFLATELKPAVDARFRTLPARETTGVGGSSLGGLVSLAASAERPETFGVVAALSPATWWDGRAVLGQVDALAGKPQRPLRVYLDSGDSGPAQDDAANTALLAARFRALGYRDGDDLLYVLARGATHAESAWAARLPGALRFLFPVP
jgi:predicted alpha/beta superfamily hydrolase